MGSEKATIIIKISIRTRTCAIIRGSVLKNCPVEIDAMSMVFAGDNTTSMFFSSLLVCHKREGAKGRFQEKNVVFSFFIGRGVQRESRGKSSGRGGHDIVEKMSML
jgi:hypothetical protein